MNQLANICEQMREYHNNCVLADTLALVADGHVLRRTPFLCQDRSWPQIREVVPNTWCHDLARRDRPKKVRKSEAERSCCLTKPLLQIDHV